MKQKILDPLLTGLFGKATEEKDVRLHVDGVKARLNKIGERQQLLGAAMLAGFTGVVFAAAEPTTQVAGTVYPADDAAVWTPVTVA